MRYFCVSRCNEAGRDIELFWDQMRKHMGTFDMRPRKAQITSLTVNLLTHNKNSQSPIYLREQVLLHFTSSLLGIGQRFLQQYEKNTAAA